MNNLIENTINIIDDLIEITKLDNSFLTLTFVNIIVDLAEIITLLIKNNLT